MSRPVSSGDLIDKVVDIYSVLLNGENVDDEAESNYILGSIRFLKDVRQKQLSTSNMAADKIHLLFSLLLDASGIVAATEGNVASLTLGDTTKLGKKKEIRKSVLMAGDEKIRDWMCSVLFQGWVRAEGRPFSISKDLRYIVGKGQKSCDFMISGESALPTLVECKRIHPEVNGSSYAEMLPAVMQKVSERVSTVRQQFESTEAHFNMNNSYRLLVLDISQYGADSVLEREDMKITGLQKETDIELTISSLRDEAISGIDEIRLCWSNIYYFEGAPRALAYYTSPLLLGCKKNDVDYDGWTVEFYPRGRQTHQFLELRVSSIARSSDWIRLSWFTTTDRLLTYTPEQLPDDGIHT
jgi:hypothetical protein